MIGAGPVGRAIFELIHELEDRSAHSAYLRDVTPADVEPPRAEVLHIAFPFGPDFVEAVRGYQLEYDADLTVIHSTVPVGTSDGLGAVHSPVRGREELIAESLRSFVKYFGGPRAAEAATVFRAAGVTCAIVSDARTTEAGKLWELVQFGVQVAVEKAIHRYCETWGIDRDIVYREFAATYNDGYMIVGEPHFHRPILDHVPGPIGGKCVVAGARMLRHPLSSGEEYGILDIIEDAAREEVPW